MAHAELSNRPHHQSSDGFERASGETSRSEAWPDDGSRNENTSGETNPQALAMHRQFLQEVLSEVMPVFSLGTPSDDRLISALQIYWEACFSRRPTRRKVMQLAAGTPIEAHVEPLGRPFFHMVVSELWSSHGSNSAAIAADVYRRARAVAVDEALADRRMPERRQETIASIRR